MNFCIRENDIFGYGNIMQASEAFVQHIRTKPQRRATELRL